MTRPVNILAALLAAGALSSIAAPMTAVAQPAAIASEATNRLFSDSRLIVLPRISVEVVGKGPDLILIPGLSSSRATWKATAERLRTHYRLHLVQVAGFSGEPARANATGDVVVPTAEAIDGYIVSQHLAPAVLIGHSLGATMSLYLAEHHPDHVKKALLVDCVPFFAQVMFGAKSTVESATPIAAQIRDGMIAAAPGAGDAALKPRIDSMVTGPADQATVFEWSKASNTATVAHALYDDLTLDLRPGLAATRTPLIILYPDNASLGASAAGMDAAYHGAFEPLPKKTLKRVDGSRHFIMLDQPATFAADLDDFLAH